MFIIGSGSLVLLLLVFFLLMIVVIFNRNLRRKQTEAFKQLLDAVENEKQRIGQDLHDDVGPILAGIKLGMDSLRSKVSDNQEVLERIDSYKTAISQAVDGIRSSAHDLSPATLSKYGLVYAIQETCSRINDAGKCKVELNGDLDQTPDSFQTISLYRMVNELIHNAIRHSEASSILVSFESVAGFSIITVTDNGKGFDYKHTLTSGTGLGLINLNNRASLIRASVDVQSKLQKGTTITIKTPLKNN